MTLDYERDNKLLTAAIFNNLRILHNLTPQDTYILNYLAHWHREGDLFFDVYHLAFWFGTYHHPKKILEIGSRTGLSIAQLLSPYVEFRGVRVCLFDFWNDGLATPELVKKNLNYLGIHTEKIEFYQGDSHLTIPDFKKTNEDKFDWILVDGDHSPEGAYEDLENVVGIVANGGMIVFDDICEFDGVVLRPTWEKFKGKYFNDFVSWHENTHGKGVGWAVK